METANIVGKGLRQVRPPVRGMFYVWRVNLDAQRNS